MRTTVLCICLFLLYTKPTLGSHIKPQGNWAFQSSSQTGTYSTTSLLLTVGSDVILTEDNEISSPENRYALFGEHLTSKLTIYKPSSMDITTHFGFVFYLKYFESSLEYTNWDEADRKVVFDSGTWLDCQNGHFNGGSLVPALQILVRKGNGYQVSFGDYRSCTQRTVSQSKEMFQGWWRHIVYIKRDSYNRCTAQLSDPTSTNNDYTTGTTIDCSPFFLDDTLATIGDGAFTTYDVSDNFIGGITCIQFYNQEILPFSSGLHDMCSNSASLTQDPYFDFGPGGPVAVADVPQTLTTSSTPTTTTTTTTPPPTTTTTTPTTTTTTQATTTTTTTTTPTPPTTEPVTSCNTGSCYCSCASTNNANISGSEVQQIVDDIVDTLTVDKQSTSQEKRKKTSAHDDRQSAQVVATLGIGLCTIVGVMVIGVDLLTVFRRS